MSVVTTCLHRPEELSRRLSRDVLARAVNSERRFAVVSGDKMSALDRVVPQATQLSLLNRMVEMVVLGEDNPTWLQHKIGFKNLRNVHYYLEAARWARLVDEDEIQATSLGRRYVLSRFNPRAVLEGVRGRAFFEEVMRVTNGDVPSPEVVAGVLRRWSFRYSKGTVTRRARDFCSLFGRVIDEAANPTEHRLIIQSAWVEPQSIHAIDGVATVWPALHLAPTKRRPRPKKTAPSSTADVQLGFRWEEDA
jgi:hypothetical protein